MADDMDKKVEIKEDMENIQETQKENRESKVEVAPPTGTTQKSGKTEDVRDIEIECVTTREAEKIGKDSAVAKAVEGAKTENVALMETSNMYEHYTSDKFGRIDTISSQWSGKAYSVNMHPVPLDQSPWKEDPPKIEDCQPITSFNAAFRFENTYVYSFQIPEGGRRLEASEDYDLPVGGATLYSIPALTILKNNLLGLPTVSCEWPVISSPNPKQAASYLHAVQHRIGKQGVMDLRFNITADSKRKLVETYVLGRLWTPLVSIKIAWGVSPDNYDAAQPILFPAFAEMGRITLDTRKEMNSVVQNLRFIERTFSPDLEQSILRIMQSISNTKLSLSRLYWRIWSAICEASYWENRDVIWTVRKIRNSCPTVKLNGPALLKALFAGSENTAQPFFITESMVEALNGTPIKTLMQFLLCENFESVNAFGLTECWPPLGDVRVVLPGDHMELLTLPTDIEVRSSDLYAILQYFAETLGQQNLIDEIGRTVACFLLRPEGDKAWLGHKYISIKLPPFRSKRSLHFAWAMQGHALNYPFKTPPFYKIAWMGSIRYMQISLAANATMNELGVYTALQLRHNGTTMPKEWYNSVNKLFLERSYSTELAEKIQQIGLRCDWGCILNRITKSVIILAPKIANLTRIVQWYEWLMFQRILPEGTWMAGQMAHIRAKSLMRPHRSYSPTLCGIESGINDLFYRIMTTNVAKIMLYSVEPSAGKFNTREIGGISGATGLPLDGQFRYMSAGDDVSIYYHIVPRNLACCHNIMYDWHERTKYHWQMYMPQQYFHTGPGKLDGDIILQSFTLPPDEAQFGTVIHSGEQKYDAVQEAKNEWEDERRHIVFGNPEDTEAGREEHHNEERQPRYFDISNGLDVGFQQGSVELEEVESQRYPIHYCQEETNPSVGARMIKEGIRFKNNVCGVNAMTGRQIMNAARSFEEEVRTYKYIPSQYADVYRRTRYRIPQTEVLQYSDNESGSRAARSIVAESIREKEREAFREAANIKEQKHQQKTASKAEVLKKRGEDARATVEVAPPVRVAATKQLFYTWSINHEADPKQADGISFWKMLDSMEEVSLTAPGSRNALKNRYSEIIRAIDCVDLLQVLRGIQPDCRAEFCRVMSCLLHECAQYLSTAPSERAVHEHAVKFFSTAADNLMHCAALSTEELVDLTGNVNARISDWSIVATMSSESYLNLCLAILGGDATGDDMIEAMAKQGQEVADAEAGIITKVQEKQSEMTKEPEKAVVQAIDEQMSKEVHKGSTEEQQGFQSGDASYSAQSPKSSASSAVPATTQSHAEKKAEKSKSKKKTHHKEKDAKETTTEKAKKSKGTKSKHSHDDKKVRAEKKQPVSSGKTEEPQKEASLPATTTVPVEELIKTQKIPPTDPKIQAQRTGTAGRRISSSGSAAASSPAGKKRDAASVGRKVDKITFMKSGK